MLERMPGATARDARAKRYFERDLKGQRDWYVKRAPTYKQRAQLLRIFIAAGALTTFSQIFPTLALANRLRPGDPRQLRADRRGHRDRPAEQHARHRASYYKQQVVALGALRAWSSQGPSVNAAELVPIGSDARELRRLCAVYHGDRRRNWNHRLATCGSRGMARLRSPALNNA
jgi:hypothetical protein